MLFYPYISKHHLNYYKKVKKWMDKMTMKIKQTTHEYMETTTVLEVIA